MHVVRDLVLARRPNQLIEHGCEGMVLYQPEERGQGDQQHAAGNETCGNARAGPRQRPEYEDGERDQIGRGRPGCAGGEHPGDTPKPARLGVGCVARGGGECSRNRQRHQTGAQPAMAYREVLKEGMRMPRKTRATAMPLCQPAKRSAIQNIPRESEPAERITESRSRRISGPERRLESGLHPVNKGASVGEKVPVRNFALKNAVTTFEIDPFVDRGLEEVRSEEEDEERGKEEYSDSGYQGGAEAQSGGQFIMLLHTCPAKTKNRRPTRVDLRLEN